MPLDFTLHLGLGPMALRAARGDHDVVVTGPSLALQRMIPSLSPMINAAGLVMYPLQVVLWLILGVTRPGADIPAGTLMAEWVVHVQRLGAAFDRCILGGLDTSACTPSVARVRLKRLGARLFALDPAPFTVLNADLYATVASPPIAGVVQPVCVPPEAAAALLLWFVSGDGTFEALGDIEPVALPRILPADRVNGGGLTFLFFPAVRYNDASMPAGLAALIPIGDRAKAAVDRMISQSPDPMLADLVNTGAARMAHVTRMSVLDTLDASNVDCALAHLDVLRLAVEPGAVNGSEALRLLGEIERAVHGRVSLTLDSLDSTNKRLHYLRDRMQRPDVLSIPSSDRVTILLAEHAIALEREGSGRASRPAAAGDPAVPLTGRTGATGYPSAHNLALRAKLNSAAFGAVQGLLERLCLGVPAGPMGYPPAIPPEHPYVVITAILRSREVIFWHALMGYKSVIPGVPLVKHIATEIAPHGAYWLGDLACRCILPPGQEAILPPALAPEWNSFCDGNLLLDYETLECRIRAHALGPNATYDVIPQEQHWTSRLRLVSMTSLVPRMLDEMGYPSPPGSPNTPLDILNLASVYASEGKGLEQSSVFAKIKTAVSAVFVESSTRLHRALRADDPDCPIAGQFVVSDSHQALSLIAARGKVAAQNELQQNLAMLPGQTGRWIAPHVSGDDLIVSVPVRAGGASNLAGDDAAEAAKASKAAAEAEALAAKAKRAAKLKTEELAAKVEVGSKADDLVEYHVDGVHLLLGVKKAGVGRDIISLPAFQAAAPRGSCPEVWCSKGKHPWALCTKKGQAGHTTQTGGAHAVHANFKFNVLPTLLVTAAALGGAQGSYSPEVFPAAPCDAAWSGAAFPLVKVAGLSHSLSGNSTLTWASADTTAGLATRAGLELLPAAAFPAVGPASLADAAVVAVPATPPPPLLIQRRPSPPPLAELPLLSPPPPTPLPVDGSQERRCHVLGLPLVDVEAAPAGAVVLLPICFDEGVARVGLPGGSSTLAFGTRRLANTRDSCARPAQTWVDALFAPRTDVYAYYQLTIDQGGTRPLLVVAALVADPQPVSLPSSRVDTPAQLASRDDRQLVWASAGALTGRLYLALGGAWAGLQEMVSPSAMLHRARITYGALELTAVAPIGGTVRSCATLMDWASEVVPEAIKTTEALRTELRRVCTAGLHPPDVTAVLDEWYDSIQAPAFGEINLSLRESCYRADDVRLAALPFPSHCVPVPTDPMAPLPPPPDHRLVPSWATSLERHALLPEYARELHLARARIHDRLLWSLQHHGDMSGAPPPRFFAFGPEGFQPWAAKLVRDGHILDAASDGGKIRLRDQSAAPKPVWNVGYLDAFLGRSVDKGLRCAVVTHGFSYLCERPPITVVQDHLLSMYKRGLSSVHEEMKRLTELRRYELTVYPKTYAVPSLPLYYGANGTVVRTSDPSRDRRIVDGKAPRRLRLTFNKKAVVESVGASCGWDESKAIHRAANAAPGWLRHSPAFRKQPLAAALLGPPPRIAASSTTPSQARAQSLAAGLAPAAVESASAAHLLRPRHPPELKWLFVDLMLSCCIMAHAGLLLNEPLITQEDDEADCFFQFVLSVGSQRDAWIALLEPDAVTSGDTSPAMADYMERVLSMGTPPSSCWAQRFNTEIGCEYERLCAADDVRQIASLRASNALFDAWVVQRKSLALRTGLDETALSKSFWYTDDPCNLTVGVARAVRNLATWICHTGPRGANLVMGKPKKRHFGVGITWIGGKGLLTGLIGYISDGKQVRTLAGIDEALAGRSTLEDYEKLAGLLNHLVCLLCMQYTVMYGIYEVHDLARDRGLAGSDPAPLTERATASLGKWRAAVAVRAGTSMLAAAFDTATAPVGVIVRRMYSDAARTSGGGDLQTDPAICGNMYQQVWIVPLGTAELELPIVVTEFFGAMFNLITFFPMLVGEGDTGAPVALIIDSLVVPIIMISRASHGSPMMQWMHEVLLSLPEYQALEGRLYAMQTYGPRNFIVDAGSRGRLVEMASVMRQLGLELSWVSVPDRCHHLLRAAVERWRTLSPGERQTGVAFASSTDGAYRFPYADGAPTFVRSARPPAADPLAARFLASARPTTAHAPVTDPAPLSHAARPLLWATLAPASRAPSAEAAAIIDMLSPSLPPSTLRPAPNPYRAPMASTAAVPGPLLRAARGPPTSSPPAPVAYIVPPVMPRHAAAFRSPRPPDEATAGLNVTALTGRQRILEELQAFNIGDLSMTPTIPENEASAGSLMLGAMLNTDPHFALRPADPSVLSSMADTVADTLAGSFAASTKEKDDGHMKKWRNVCTYFNTPALRTNASANSGLDANGHVTECVLQAFALLAFYVAMEPRAKADAAVGPDPQSAMNNLRGVHRYHSARGITMASTALASRVLTGIMRTYVRTCGIREVRRKKPLTNPLINGMLATPEGATLFGVVVIHLSYAWVATVAWVSLLSESGERKDEVAKEKRTTRFELGRLSFASLVFKIAAHGGEVFMPTRAQVMSMNPAAGDGVYLKHGRAKNDFFGIFFAPTPSFLPFRDPSPRNAARSLRALYLLALDAGLTPALAPLSPLFGPNFGEEFTHWEVETYFEIMMRFGANVSVDDLKDYSIHSFRIFVACALLAANVPRPIIKRVLRWRGDLSLEIYARLNDDEWAQHVTSTYTAHVDSTIAARLASLGTLDLEHAALRLQTFIAAA